jgi:hypothetical protein
VNITSAWNTSNTAAAILSGTSMACPHVSGCAALYLQQYPTATPATVHTAIVNTSAPNRISNVPATTVNALVNSLRAGTGPAAPAAPTGVAGKWCYQCIAPRHPVMDCRRRCSKLSGTSIHELHTSNTSYSASGVTTTSVTTGTLAANTTYYWRVNASNAKGTSSYSTTRSFKTGNQ